MQSDYKLVGLSDVRLTRIQGYYLNELRDLLVKCEREGLSLDVTFTPKNPTLSRKLKVKVTPND